MMMGFGGIWFIFFIFIIIGVVTLIIWALKRSNFTSVKEDNRKSSLEVLKERYDKRKITKKEFEDAKKEITGFFFNKKITWSQ
ncbi:MAG: SHOCT domain-containing protein [Actinobacteria bacterium]|nr:SHOCT domain-containing protein [Actinomycetota bacterium]